MEEADVVESMAEEASVPGAAEEAAFTESVEVAAITGLTSVRHWKLKHNQSVRSRSSVLLHALGPCLVRR